MNKLAVIVLLAGLAGCSRSKPQENRETAPSATPGTVLGGGAAPNANPGSASGSAPGSAGSAGSAESGGAAAPAAGPVGCATPTTLTCEAGQRDGCTGGLTAVHVCVAGDAKAGPPCAQELALKCPDGQVDACLRNPPLATSHVCVFAVIPKGA